MSSNSADDKLVKNEQFLRDKNVSASRGLRKYFRNDTSVRNAPVAFICECSHLECDEHVAISIDRYEQLHKRGDRFVVSHGHVTEHIEKIISKESDYIVVEKYALPR